MTKFTVVMTITRCLSEGILKEIHRYDRGRGVAGARTHATGRVKPTCVFAAWGRSINKACRGLNVNSTSAALSFKKEKGKRKVAAPEEGFQFSQVKSILKSQRLCSTSARKQINHNGAFPKDAALASRKRRS